MKLIGTKIIRLNEVDSTNNYANAQSVAEHEEGTVFLAEAQTLGRGQHDNFWESEPGKNLTFSILLKPFFIEPAQQFMISKVVALGLADFVQQYCNEVLIKWPNDIFAGKKKIAGILIENSIMGEQLGKSIVGVGININQEHFTSSAPNPVSLKQLTGHTYNLDDCLEDMLQRIGEWYLMLQSEDFPAIDKAYEERLLGLGQWLDYSANDTLFQGRIEGVNEFGQLVITDADGEVRTFDFKEVKFL